MKLTTIILVKETNNRLEKLISKLRWSNEIILIKDSANEEKREGVGDSKVKIFKRKLNNNFAAQRNFALKKAKNNWVLFVDQDETISPSLAKEIVRRISKTNCTAFYLPRKEFFLEKPLRCADKSAYDWSLGPNKLVRLGQKDKGKWVGKVHEEWQFSGKVGILKNSLEHHSFRNVREALKKINHYSSIQAQEWVEKGREIDCWGIIFFPIGKLFKNLFWHQGWQDGTTGLIYCLLMSLQSFLSKAKLWQLRSVGHI